MDNLNGRRSGGFSLRKSLEQQGVTEGPIFRWHLDFVHGMLTGMFPNLDITRYRVNPKDPNAIPNMG